MANIKISQLPSLGTLSGADQFPVVSGGTTYNVTANVAQSYMSTSPGGTFTGAVFSATDRVEATGNVQAGNVRTSGQISATGTVQAGNVSATANVIAAGNLGGANLSVTGTATVPTPDSNSANTQVATTNFVATRLPAGVILMWSGSIASIPSGWLLCDGTNGTPNLQDRFVVGAGSTYAVGATGGSANATLVSHSHTTSSVVTDPGHAHIYNTKTGTPPQAGSSTPCWNGDANATTSVALTGVLVNVTVNSAGSSATNANLPPYYALAYIMKA